MGNVLSLKMVVADLVTFDYLKNIYYENLNSQKVLFYRVK